MNVMDIAITYNELVHVMQFIRVNEYEFHMPHTASVRCSFNLILIALK